MFEIVFSIIVKKIAKRHWNSDNLIILLALNVNVTSFYCLLHFEPAAANWSRSIKLDCCITVI